MIPVPGPAASPAAAAPSPSRRAALPTAAHALPPWTRLSGACTLRGVLHVGDCGVSYLADAAGERRPIVVKEFLPVALALRAPGTTAVVSLADAPVGAFDAGLKAFVDEARLLLGEHPGLVSVLGVWQENGTAYMALPQVAGTPLRRLLAVRGAAPDEAELRGWLRRLLDTLATLHAAGPVHGRITADTIMIGPQGPTLLGFGAGRHAVAQALGQPAEALDAGYAAIEQYEATPAAALGPWTDLYALASVIYGALTGHAPMAAPLRRGDIDPLPPLRELVAGRYTDSLITAVDNALAVAPDRRPHDVAAFRALLNGGHPATRRAARATGGLERANRWRPDRALIAGATVCALAFGTLAGVGLGPRWGWPELDSTPLLLPPTDAGPALPAAPGPAPLAKLSRTDASLAAADAALAAASAPASPGGSSAGDAWPAELAWPDRPVAAPSQVGVPALPEHVPERAAQPRTPTAASNAPSRIGTGVQCLEMLRRASLDDLHPAETSVLKKECQ